MTEISPTFQEAHNQPGATGKCLTLESYKKILSYNKDDGAGQLAYTRLEQIATDRKSQTVAARDVKQAIEDLSITSDHSHLTGNPDMGNKASLALDSLVDAYIEQTGDRNVFSPIAGMQGNVLREDFKTPMPNQGELREQVNDIKSNRQNYNSSGQKKSLRL